MLLRNTTILASIAIVAATQVPRFHDMMMQAPAEQSAGKSAPLASPAVRPQPAALQPGRINLKADGRGHFYGTFRMNGKPVDGMIDTGATSVAINESTARRLGFSANRLDFRYAVSTANGRTESARVVLDRVEIGTLRVRDVEAFVLRDEALSGTLVGMSFLRKLKSFRTQDGGLTLEQ